MANRTLSYRMARQFEAENSGLPAASLMSAAQTFWIAVTTLAGIGT